MSLSLRDLTKRYRTGRLETTALNGVSVDLKDGEFLAVMGPSGCGKSTLLNIAGLIDRPDEGKVEFNGIDLENKSASELAKIRKSNIGFIFQGFNLLDSLSVLDNVALPLKFQGVRKDERINLAKGALNQVGLTHRSEHRPSQLSGGQQQRVAIARAFVSEPALILADEPTGNLDNKTGLEVMGLLAALQEKGSSILMVTHSVRDSEFADRIIQMENGEVLS